MEQQNTNAATQEETLGGTTNLSLEQLKAEGGTTTPSEDNIDQPEDADDLHEIQAGDDLDEPGLDDDDDDDLEATGADEAITDDELDEESAENPENNT
jgi:hypothetical protein